MCMHPRTHHAPRYTTALPLVRCTAARLPGSGAVRLQWPWGSLCQKHGVAEARYYWEAYGLS